MVDERKKSILDALREEAVARAIHKREMQNIKSRAYYAANREKISTRRRAHRLLNQDALNAEQRKRFAESRGAEYHFRRLLCEVKNQLKYESDLKVGAHTVTIDGDVVRVIRQLLHPHHRMPKR